MYLVLVVLRITYQYYYYVLRSIAAYNDKNSEFRKKSDKEVAAFSIASEIDKNKSKLEYNQFFQYQYVAYDEDKKYL